MKVVDRTPDTSSSPPTGKSTTKVRSRTTDGEASDSMYENVPLAKFKIVKTEKVNLSYITFCFNILYFMLSHSNFFLDAEVKGLL